MDSFERLHDARALLDRAHETLRDIRARAPGLAAAASWRCRAADEFVDALDEWRELLHRIDGELESWDAGLARLQRRALAAQGAG